MSTPSDDTTSGPEVGIGDDRLPEDLVSGEDNPLAEPLADGESVEDLMEDGKPANEQEPSGDGPGAVEG